MVESARYNYYVVEFVSDLGADQRLSLGTAIIATIQLKYC